MNLKLKCLKSAAVVAVLFGLMPGLSYAATCVVDTPNPDSMITGAEGTTQCGIGSGNHPTDSALDGFITSGSWTEISKVDSGAGGTSGQLSYTGETFDGGAATTGDWGFDFAGHGYSHLALILKDGDIVGSEGKWVWFLVDLQGSCPAGTSGLPATADLCGEWYMYGTGTTRKAISYMSIWGIEGGGKVPAPASLWLMSLGLAGMALVQRRRRNAG